MTAAVRSRDGGVRRLEYESLEGRNHVFCNIMFIPTFNLSEFISLSFNNDFFSIYYMPGANLGAHKALLHRIEKTPVFLEPSFKER